MCICVNGTEGFAIIIHPVLMVRIAHISGVKSWRPAQAKVFFPEAGSLLFISDKNPFFILFVKYSTTFVHKKCHLRNCKDHLNGLVDCIYRGSCVYVYRKSVAAAAAKKKAPAPNPCC